MKVSVYYSELKHIIAVLYLVAVIFQLNILKKLTVNSKKETRTAYLLSSKHDDIGVCIEGG